MLFVQLANQSKGGSLGLTGSCWASFNDWTTQGNQRKGKTAFAMLVSPDSNRNRSVTSSLLSSRYRSRIAVCPEHATLLCLKKMSE